jgi:hypothetical protein
MKQLLRLNIFALLTQFSKAFLFYVLLINFLNKFVWLEKKFILKQINFEMKFKSYKTIIG